MGQSKRKQKKREKPRAAPVRIAPADRPQAAKRDFQKRFLLEKLLGVGGMCEVFSALDLWRVEWSDAAPKVAIKRLIPELSENRLAQMALAQEFFTLRHLVHPGVVRVYDLHPERSGVCFSMELLEGPSLHQALAGRPAGYGKDGVRMAGKLFEALSYLHGKGVVHADIKPANLYPAPEERLVLIDFNISQVTPMPGAARALSAQRLLADLRFHAHSLLHASPERLKTERPSKADDVFSASCTVYEMITGRHPFNRLSAVEAEQKQMTPSRPDALSGAQWKALSRGLSFASSDRPNAGELWRVFSATSKISQLVMNLTG